MIARRTAAILGLAAFLMWGAGNALAQSQPQAAPTGSDAQPEQLGAPSAVPTMPVEVTQTGGGPQINGINIYDMFLRADPIVKSVMGLLVFASLWSWAIIFNKWLALGSLGRRADKFEKLFWSGL